LQGLKSLLSLNLNEMANYYGLKGGVGKALVYPVDPESFSVAVDDFETCTLTWDEGNMDANAMRLQYSEGTIVAGTVSTTDGSLEIIGAGTKFTKYKIRDLVLITGNLSRKISHIYDDLRMQVDIPATATEDTLDMFVCNNDWVELTPPASGVETLTVNGLKELTTYFFRMSTHKRLQWSPWVVHYVVTTDAE
jgi:hypothetical protein